MDKEEKQMITVPYDDFVAGVEALRIIISARQMLASNDAYASPALRAILGAKNEKNN